MKRNKGITLIALVITIIVLLILAGVAISMLSGENGILKKAAEAKTKTEEGQKQEATTLNDMEIDSHFIVNGSKYKCRNGYITGIEMGEKVKSLKDALPSNYKIYNREKTAEITDIENTEITTGMAIMKDNEEVARTVIFGELDGINRTDIGDIDKIESALNGREYEKFLIAAMDVNGDKKVNMLDYNMVMDVIMHRLTKIPQDRYAENAKVELRSELEKEYREKLIEKIEGTNYTIEKDSEGIYWLKGIDGNKTVENIKEELKPLNVIVKRKVKKYNEIDDEEILLNSDQINIVSDDGRELVICYISL